MLKTEPSVSISRSVSLAFLHGSVNPEPSRSVDSEDLVTPPRVIGKRLPKSTRRDFYVTHVFVQSDVWNSLSTKHAVGKSKGPTCESPYRPCAEGL